MRTHRGVGQGLFEKVKLSITDRCEGSCAFCYRGPILGTTYLPAQIVFRTLNEAIQLGTKSFHLSGGNPMLHPRFDEILREMCRFGLPTKLSTNSTYLTPDLLLRYISLGLTSLAVSLNAANETTNDAVRGIPGDFRRTCALLAAVPSAFRTIITFVVLPSNVMQVHELASLLSSHPGATVKLQLVEPSLLPDERTGNDDRLSVAQLHYLYGTVGPQLQADFVDRVVLIPPPPAPHEITASFARWATGDVGMPRDRAARCEYMLSNPHIKEDGNVYACCGKDPARIVGNLHQETLMRMYTRHEELFRRHRFAPYPGCHRCVFYSHYRNKVLLSQAALEPTQHNGT